jgi:hypothetical protein
MGNVKSNAFACHEVASVPTPCLRSGVCSQTEGEVTLVLLAVFS